MNKHLDRIVSFDKQPIYDMFKTKFQFTDYNEILTGRTLDALSMLLVECVMNIHRPETTDGLVRCMEEIVARYNPNTGGFVCLVEVELIREVNNYLAMAINRRQLNDMVYLIEYPYSFDLLLSTNWEKPFTRLSQPQLPF